MRFRSGASWCAAAALVLLLASPASAKKGDFSLGAILGDPTGVTLKGDLGETFAIQSHVGFGFFPGDGVTVLADAIWDLHDFLAEKGKDVSLWFYMGAGAKFHWFTGRYFAYRGGRARGYSSTDVGLGARGVAGLRISWHDEPFDLFFELAPLGFLVVVTDPDIYYDLDAGIGFRYRF